MKNTLLLICFLAGVGLQAQDFWTQFSTAQPITSTGVRSISIVNSSTTWLNMGCGVTGCTPIRRYAKTTNGGTVWTTGEIDLGPQSSNLEIANIHGVSSLVAYAAVFPTMVNAFGGVWKTSDGGSTWIKQPTASFSNAESFANLVYFWNANEGVVMGHSVDGYIEIYTTVNGGDTWTRVPSSPSLIQIATEEYGVRYNFATVGNTIWVQTPYGRILKSIDKGINWTDLQSPFPGPSCGFIGCEPLPKITFSDQNNGLLRGSNCELYDTHDGGATWGEVLWSGVLRNFGMTAVPGLPNTYISTGEDIDIYERGSSFSIDGGLTWFDINNNPDLEYVNGSCVVMLNEDYGFAGGFSSSATEGGIFRWGGGAMLRTAILNNAISSADNLFKAYPNPTTGILHIIGAKITEVTIYDLFGQKIAATIYGEGNTVATDLSFLADGIYVVKVSNDKGTTLMKVLKQ